MSGKIKHLRGIDCLRAELRRDDSSETSLRRRGLGDGLGENSRVHSRRRLRSGNGSSDKGGLTGGGGGSGESDR